MNYNEATKKNQGDETIYNQHDRDRNVIVTQPGSNRCPVGSYKLYISKLNDESNVFFQTPNQLVIVWMKLLLSPTTKIWKVLNAI